MEKSNVEVAKRLDINRLKVWKIVKKFHETGKHLYQGAEENKVSAPLNSSTTRGKAATTPSPKLQNLGHRSRCEQIHHESGIEGRSGGEALQDAAPPGAYGHSCGHEGLIMQGNPPGDGRRHTAKTRVHGREEIRYPAGGKPAK